MDNGEFLIDDPIELFDSQNDSHSLFNWADEFLGDSENDLSGGVTAESGNLATSINQSNHPLSSQTVSASVSSSSSQLSSLFMPPSSLATATALPVLQQQQQQQSIMGQTVINTLQNTSGLTGSIVQPSSQQYILKTSQGSIQLTPQQHLQLQQQILQQQQQQQQQQQINQFVQSSNSSAALSQSTLMSSSVTPNSSTIVNSLGTPSTQTTTLLKRASPAPNVNIVHLPNSHHQPQQQPQQQQQSFQLTQGAFLQIPYSATGQQNLVNTALIQGSQAGTLVNAQNTVIQNPNVVNLNVAAPQFLCNTSTQQHQQQLQNQQQQRQTFGIPTPNPFNIQGTLIQTAEGKSILIPSQNMAQPINIQQLSVATPVGTQPIQQSIQNSIGNMIQFAPANMDSRTTQGVSQIMVNAQGQQILLQRSAVGTNQSQNFIVRTQGGQSNVIQLPQRPASQSGQIQTQPLQQALAAAAGGQQQFKLIGQSSSQAGVPMVNIGGQNYSLQQLTSQLGNIPGLQLVQQQQTPSPQQQQQQQVQVTLQQGQGQQMTFQQQMLVSSSGGQQVIMQAQGGQTLYTVSKQVTPQANLFMSQAQSGPSSTLSSQHSGLMMSQSMSQSQAVSQSQINQTQLHQSKMNTTASSTVEQQTQQILQRIHNQLQMSQANATSRSSPTIARPASRSSPFGGSNSQSVPNVNIKTVKLEPAESSTLQGCSQISNGIGMLGTSSTNILESLVKQEPQQGVNCSNNSLENNVLSQAASLSGINRLLPNSGQNTSVTTTVSQASTSMSVLVVSNSSQLHLNNSIAQSASTNTFNMTNMTFFGENNTGSNTSTTQSLPVTTSTPSPQVHKAGATLKTIHLPPDLQQQFQKVQFEIRKVNAATNMSTAEKRTKLQQLQIFQRKILLKGRVLATTKAEPQQLQQSLAALTQSGQTVLNQAGQVLNPSNVNQFFNQSTSTVAPTGGAGNQSIQQVLSSQTGTSNILTSNQMQQNNSSLAQQGPNRSLAGLLSPSSSSTPTTNQGQSGASNHGHNTSIGTLSTDSLTTTGASAASQVAVPTQIKVANKVLTLSLTPALRDKIQYYLKNMTYEQQEQYLQSQQHVIQKLQKQKPPGVQVLSQVEQQQQKQSAGIPSTATSQLQSQSTTLTGGTSVPKPIAPLTSKPTEASSSNLPELKTIPVPTSLAIAESSQRVQKRSLMDIPKGTLIHQQIRQDQNHALNPDCKRPFRSRSDACRRLLRFHVLQNFGPPPELMDKFDEDFEDISADLLKKKDSMMDRFRLLLLQETIRSEKSSELVMLQRMQIQDLRKTIEMEKEMARTDPANFQPMPTRFLCKDEKTADIRGIKRELSVKEEDDQSDDEQLPYKMSKVEQLSPSLSARVKSEPRDQDLDEISETKTLKMKKLVIKKSDGQNFHSSFKRTSLDSVRSSGDDDETMNESASNEGTNIGSVSTAADADSHAGAGFDDDDEDTNDYSDQFSNIQDEAAVAAMAISSAEDSQGSPVDDDSNSFNQYGLSLRRQSSENDKVSVEHMGQKSGFRGNFELADESVYIDQHESKTEMNFDEVFSNSSVSKYIPNHSPVSNDGDADTQMTGSSTNGVGGAGDNGRYADNFRMYQPITESLTDSEENSYYSADNAADVRSVLPKDQHYHHHHNVYRSSGGNGGNSNGDIGGARGSRMIESEPLWTKTAQFDVSDSEGEEDPEVKAQMESAINSILSLSQGVSNNDKMPSVYDFDQSNQFLNNFKQPPFSISTCESLGSGDNSQSNLDIEDMLTQGSQSYESEDDTNIDLESAVNSILM